MTHPNSCTWLGTQRKQTSSHYKQNSKSNQRFWFSYKKNIHIQFFKKEKPNLIHQSPTQSNQKIQTTTIIRRLRTRAPWKKSQQIPKHTQKNIQTRIFPTLHSRTQPMRTMLETSTKKTHNQNPTHNTRNAIPPKKNIQQHKKTTKNVHIFRRLAISLFEGL